jgi:uncharacterized Zn finger protein
MKKWQRAPESLRQKLREAHKRKQFGFPRGINNPRYSMGITVECVECGKVKRVTESIYRACKSQHFFCDNKCRGAFLKYHPTRRRDRITVCCANCGKERKIKRSVLADSITKRFFCNRRCMGAFREGKIPAHSPRLRVMVRCPVCGAMNEKRPSKPSNLCGKQECRSALQSRRNTGKSSPL